MLSLMFILELFIVYFQEKDHSSSEFHKQIHHKNEEIIKLQRSVEDKTKELSVSHSVGLICRHFNLFCDIIDCYREICLSRTLYKPESCKNRTLFKGQV